MSYSNEVYIGSYLVIAPYTNTGEFERYVCGCKSDHEYKPFKKFCSKCGGEFKLTMKKEFYTPNEYELLVGEYEECLSSAGFDGEKIFLMANEHYRGDEQNIDQSNDFNAAIELTSDMIEKDLMDFKNYYKKVIKYLTPLCEIIEIKFGVIKYCN